MLEITHILWYLAVHYCPHDSLPLFCNLGQMNSVHSLPSYFIMIHFNINLTSMAMSSKWSPSYRLIYLINPINILSHINHEAPYYVIFSNPRLPGPNIFLSASFTNALSLWSYLKFWILGFTFIYNSKENLNSEYSNTDVWDRKCQDKRFWTKWYPLFHNLICSLHHARNCELLVPLWNMWTLSCFQSIYYLYLSLFPAFCSWDTNT